MSISPEIIPICALQDNYIWMLFDRYTKKAWIIDPGEAKPVLQALEAYKLELSGILITHHHFDHSDGVKELIHKYKNIPVYGSHRSPLPFITHRLHEGDEVSCANVILKAIEIPGHTLDHTAFFGSKCLFSGDTLFSAGCGRIFEGTPELMHHSLQKLASLPDDTKIYCGHEYTLANLNFALHVEPSNILIEEKIASVKNTLAANKATLPSTMQDEKNINPFLRCGEPTIIKAVEKHSNMILDSQVAVFAKLREWKNQFKS